MSVNIQFTSYIGPPAAPVARKVIPTKEKDRCEASPQVLKLHSRVSNVGFRPKMAGSPGAEPNYSLGKLDLSLFLLPNPGESFATW